MKRNLKLLLAVLVVLMSIIAVFTISAVAEEKEITISYMKAYEPTSTTTTLDKVAHADGKVTVKAGEKFALPTTADISYVGQEGYQLVWYTEDGRSFKAGESVSFTEDTKLFRAVLKEVYTVDELSAAMSTNSHGALLMTDINGGNAYINVWDQNYAILDLNGYTLSIEKNGTVMGGQRSAKIIVGKGTFKVTNPDGKVGAYAVFECKGHGTYGNNNKTIVGKNVIIDAPNFYLCTDTEGTGATSYPWIRIYGTINVNYILARWGGGNPAPQIEFFDGCNVTITGPRLVVDYKVPTDTTIYNKQSFEIRIYGGTFNLPAEAATEEFWTVDNVANEDTLTVENKDHIKIEGGTFVLPDNAVPAISSYLTDDYVRVTENFNDFVKNSRDSVTREVTYKGIRNAYKITLKKDGTFTLVDNMGTGLGGTYYASFTKTSDSNSFETFELFEDAEKTIPLTTIICQPGSKNGLLFSTPEMRTDYALQNLTANGVTYQVVVTAKCGTNANHSFNTEQEATVEANCIHTAYANYVCSGCGYSAYFNWGDLADHTFSLTNDTNATATTLGEKTFACSSCNDVKAYPYTIDPTSLEVTVVIRNDDGTFETKTVLASDIFDFSTSGVEGAYVYTLVGIKKFDTYQIRNIYGITIPVGIMYVKITSQNYEKYYNVEYGVTELVIPDGADVSLLNIGNLRRLKTIKIGKANVIFGKSCSYYSPNNERRDLQVIETIDMSTPGATVYFDEYAFDSRTKVKELIFADDSNYTFCNKAFYKGAITELDLTKNSTYDIRNESFAENDFLEIIVPDNATNITFSGSPFKNCLTKYFYLGKNFVLDTALFYEMKYLEKVIIMDGVTFGKSFENLFYNAGSADFTTPLYVYNHSTEFLWNGGLPKNTFQNCDGVFFYTVTDGIGTGKEIFRNCTDVNDADGNLLYKAWTIYFGIPHSYDNISDPTCTEKGDIDCPCGVYAWNVHDGKWGYATFDENAEKPGTGTGTVAYKKYESVHDIKLGTTSDTATAEDTTLDGAQKTYVILPALGHDNKSVITEPLCLVAGEENLVCQREGCGYVEFVRAIDAKGHTMIYTMSYPDGFNAAGERVDKCKDCEEVTTESVAKAIFEALGYSVGPDGFSIKAGFIISKDELNAYKQVNPDFEFGVLFVNAGTVAETESFFDGKDLNASAKGLKISVDNVKYVTWNAELRGYSAAIADSLNLVIGIYTVDQNGDASVIQYADANNYTTMNKYADMTLNSVSFNEVRVAHGYEALVPPPPATGDDE